MSEFRDKEWDYGLEPGESFEPLDDEDESFDLSGPHVMTVLGPVDPGALGFTLHHEHLICNPPGAEVDQDLVLNDIAKAASELEGYFVTGGRAIVDLTTVECGRNASDLLWIAGRVPVHIVAATGFQRLPDTGRRPSIEQLSGVMIAELQSGIDRTTARAGFIRAGGEEGVLQVAAQAHEMTGAPISVTAGSENDALQNLALLRQYGVHPSSVSVGIEENVMDERSLRRILETAAFVSFQHWSEYSPESDDERAKLIVTLVDAGFGDRILVSGNLARKSSWLSYGGGPGFVHFIDLVPLQLMEAGLSAQSVRRIFFENAAEALTIRR